ncbi:hypothetical protein D3C71_1452530 [compost metagenome]
MVGMPNPSTRQTSAVKISINSTLLIDTSSTKAVMRRPRPVKVMAPTIRPAVPQAMAMPIMLRAPSCRPPMASCQPCRQAGAASCLRNQAISGRCVTIWNSMAMAAQKADSPADSSSTLRHHTRMPIGIRKYSPARTVGQGCGRTGWLTSMSCGRSGWAAAMRSSHTYRAASKVSSTQMAAAPATACTPVPIQ